MGKNIKKGGKSQKYYKMKGCSKTRKNYLGGKPNLSLAYPSSNVPTVPNPFLAYTGKGGASCSDGITPSNLAYTQNINGSNPAYPSTGPVSTGFNFLNPQTQKGGCGCGLQFGGNTHNHRVGCKCSSCKIEASMKGGSPLLSNGGIPYPNGLVGSPWTPSIKGWPGVDGISGDRNSYALNTYSPNDISRQMVNTGAAPPFSVGGKKSKKSKQSKKHYKIHSKKSQRGGTLSNFLGQDLINLGRQIQFGFGTAYNGLAGYQQPVNPLPWKGQLANVQSSSKLY